MASSPRSAAARNVDAVTSPRKQISAASSRDSGESGDKSARVEVLGINRHSRDINQRRHYSEDDDDDKNCGVSDKFNHWSSPCAS